MAKVDNLADYQLPALRSAVSAGEPLNREVIDTFRHYFNITVRDGYGQTENTLLLGVMEDMEVKPGSMGKPTPGNEVEIIDEDGHPVPPNEIGDIAVKLDSPALFLEYYKDPERTKMTQRGDYYVTGDQASKDDDGYFGLKAGVMISLSVPAIRSDRLRWKTHWSNIRLSRNAPSWQARMRSAAILSKHSSCCRQMQLTVRIWSKNCRIM